MLDIKFISKILQPKQMINRDVTLECNHFFFDLLSYFNGTLFLFTQRHIYVSLFIKLKIFVYRYLCHKNDLDIMENNDGMS